MLERSIILLNGEKVALAEMLDNNISPTLIDFSKSRIGGVYGYSMKDFKELKELPTNYINSII